MGFAPERHVVFDDLSAVDLDVHPRGVVLVPHADRSNTLDRVQKPAPHYVQLSTNLVGSGAGIARTIGVVVVMLAKGHSRLDQSTMECHTQIRLVLHSITIDRSCFGL